MTIEPDDPFGNAERVQAALGWAIVKGFVVYECADQAEGTSFVAHLRWWNARESGVWVDFTPRPAGLETLVLDPFTKETAEIWMPPEAAKKLFNVCNYCFKPLMYQCKGCDPNAGKKKNAVKRMEKKEAHKQAQARKARKAATTFEFKP